MKAIKDNKIIYVTEYVKYEEHNPTPYFSGYKDLNTGEMYESDDLEWDISKIEYIEMQEQRRYETAKNILCAMQIHKNSLYGGDPKEMTKYAISLSDELIKQLKEDKQ